MDKIAKHRAIMQKHVEIANAKEKFVGHNPKVTRLAFESRCQPVHQYRPQPSKFSPKSPEQRNRRSRFLPKSPQPRTRQSRFSSKSPQNRNRQSKFSSKSPQSRNRQSKFLSKSPQSRNLQSNFPSKSPSSRTRQSILSSKSQQSWTRQSKFSSKSSQSRNHSNAVLKSSHRNLETEEIMQKQQPQQKNEETGTTNQKQQPQQRDQGTQFLVDEPKKEEVRSLRYSYYKCTNGPNVCPFPMPQPCFLPQPLPPQFFMPPIPPCQPRLPKPPKAPKFPSRAKNKRKITIMNPDIDLQREIIQANYDFPYINSKKTTKQRKYVKPEESSSTSSDSYSSSSSDSEEPTISKKSKHTSILKKSLQAQDKQDKENSNTKSKEKKDFKEEHPERRSKKFWSKVKERSVTNAIKSEPSIGLERPKHQTFADVVRTLTEPRTTQALQDQSNEHKTNSTAKGSSTNISIKSSSSESTSKSSTGESESNSSSSDSTSESSSSTSASESNSSSSSSSGQKSKGFIITITPQPSDTGSRVTKEESKKIQANSSKQPNLGKIASKIEKVLEGIKTQLIAYDHESKKIQQGSTSKTAPESKNGSGEIRIQANSVNEPDLSKIVEQIMNVLESDESITQFPTPKQETMRIQANSNSANQPSISKTGISGTIITQHPSFKQASMKIQANSAKQPVLSKIVDQIMKAPESKEIRTHFPTSKQETMRSQADSAKQSTTSKTAIRNAPVEIRTQHPSFKQASMQIQANSAKQPVLSKIVEQIINGPESKELRAHFPTSKQETMRSQADSAKQSSTSKTAIQNESVEIRTQHPTFKQASMQIQANSAKQPAISKLVEQIMNGPESKKLETQISKTSYTETPPPNDFNQNRFNDLPIISGSTQCVPSDSIQSEISTCHLSMDSVSVQPSQSLKQISDMEQFYSKVENRSEAFSEPIQPCPSEAADTDLDKRISILVEKVRESLRSKQTEDLKRPIIQSKLKQIQCSKDISSQHNILNKETRSMKNPNQHNGLDLKEKSRNANTNPSKIPSINVKYIGNAERNVEGEAEESSSPVKAIVTPKRYQAQREELPVKAIATHKLDQVKDQKSPVKATATSKLNQSEAILHNYAVKSLFENTKFNDNQSIKPSEIELPVKAISNSKLAPVRGKNYAVENIFQNTKFNDNQSIKPSGISFKSKVPLPEKVQ